MSLEELATFVVSSPNKRCTSVVALYRHWQTSHTASSWYSAEPQLCREKSSNYDGQVAIGSVESGHGNDFQIGGWVED
jgi:hypothetical protein